MANVTRFRIARYATTSASHLIPRESYVVRVEDVDTGQRRSFGLMSDTAQQYGRLFLEAAKPKRIYQIDREAEAKLPIWEQKDELSLVIEAILRGQFAPSDPA